MPDRPSLLARVKAKVRALLPEDWRGEAGQKFRDTANSISEYSRKNVRIKERLEEGPDVAWNSLKLKSSEALVNAAEEEQTRIASELARRTLTDKARQENATADRLETEARTAKIQEMEARLALVEKLRKVNALPVWDAHGSMTVLKAPLDYDWDGLTSSLLKGPDIPLPVDQSPSEASLSASFKVDMKMDVQAIPQVTAGDVIQVSESIEIVDPSLPTSDPN